MEERIKEVIGKVLNNDLSSYKIEEITTNNIEEWDSLSHIKIIIALEQEFNIDISPEDIYVIKQGGKNIISVIEKLI